jgi:hypothetical protein
LEFFGIKPSDLPAVVTVDMSNASGMKKFFFSGDITTEAMIKHSNDFLSGSLKPSLKSEEPIPEDTAGPVKILKGKSFNAIVIDNDNDVLVEFYAPWVWPSLDVTEI